MVRPYLGHWGVKIFFECVTVVSGTQFKIVITFQKLSAGFKDFLAVFLAFSFFESRCRTLIRKSVFVIEMCGHSGRVTLKKQRFLVEELKILFYKFCRQCLLL